MAAPGPPQMKPFALVVVALFVFTGTRSGTAAQRDAARITQIVRDVNLLVGQRPPQPAAVNDNVAAGMAVRTGVSSRTELTFGDQTITRLGPDTIFSMNVGARALDLSSGSILLSLPKNIGRAQLSTAAVTAAITGTTIVLEYTPDAYFKLLVLEGTVRLFKTGNPNVFVLLHAGQMLTGNPNAPFASPVTFSIHQFLLSSILIRGFPLLPSISLIVAEMYKQEEKFPMVNAAPHAARLADPRRDRVVSPIKPPGHE
jgi:hypothetical protein